MIFNSIKRIPLVILIAVVFSTCAFAEKPAPTYADIAYGAHDRNVMDVWLVDTDTPAPMVVFIHGGGFIQGSKNGANSGYIEKCREAGVVYASINYPYYTDLALLEIIRDNIARAVQFARYNANEWNIDPERIAVYGQSAGAGSSLWIAFHDDIADPENPDPVRRESSRVSVAGAIATQATYDFIMWKKLFDGVLEPQVMKAWQMIMMQTVLDMNHVEKESQMKSKEFKPVRRELDMMSMMDPDDPPIIMQTFESRQQAGDLLHHPRHPSAVKERCDKLGMQCILILDETPEEQRVDIMDFLLENLK